MKTINEMTQSEAKEYIRIKDISTYTGYSWKEINKIYEFVKEYIDTKLDMRYSNSGVIKVKQKFDIFYLNNKRTLFNIAYNI